MTQAPTLTSQDIGEAEGALTALLEQTLAPTGKTRHEYLVLRVLNAIGPFARSSDLQDYLVSQPQVGLNRQEAAELLTRLEQEGLVSGTSSGASGPAQLSVTGREVYDQLAQAIVPVTRQVFAGLDPDDLANAHRVLRELIDRAAQLLESMKS